MYIDKFGLSPNLVDLLPTYACHLMNITDPNPPSGCKRVIPCYKSIASLICGDISGCVALNYCELQSCSAAHVDVNVDNCWTLQPGMTRYVQPGSH